jgi:hypothetical protein
MALQLQAFITWGARLARRVIDIEHLGNPTFKRQ